MQNRAEPPDSRETLVAESLDTVHPDMQNLWSQLWLCIGQLQRELQESPAELRWGRCPQATPFRLLNANKAETTDEKIEKKQTILEIKDSAHKNIVDSLPSLNGVSSNIVRTSDSQKMARSTANTANWWEAVTGCQSCQLGHEATRIRQQAIPGYPEQKQIAANSVQVLLVCDAPSYDADRLGQPLPTENLDYLLKWLQAIDLQEGYYLTNLVKCRTPGGRAAWPEETKSCAQHLHAQLRFFAPSAILALGGSAARSLSARRENLESLREQELFYEFGGHRIRLFVTYAVSEVLQNPKELRPPVWQDLKRLRAFLQGSP